MGSPNPHGTIWCIVVADDQGPEWGSEDSIEGRRPVQYCKLQGKSTMLQLALRRALRIVPSSRLALTVRECDRDLWEPISWFLPSDNRFITEDHRGSVLTGAAAVLSIAARSPSCVVVILPARCYVAHESILIAAVHQVLRMLPSIRAGVLTLGMADSNEGVNEDYLIAGREAGECRVQGFVHRPMPWVARLLKEQGAMIASGIMVGYAGIFAAHVSKHWPGLTLTLTQLISVAKCASTECQLPLSLQAGAPSSVLRALRWQSPSFAQGAFCVHGCGWSSLKSPDAVSAIANHLGASGERDSRHAVPLVRAAP